MPPHPGQIQLTFDRDSVSMGDDVTDHRQHLTFPHDQLLSAILGPLTHQLLPIISGGHATWLIQLHEPAADQTRVKNVAVTAQEWPAPRLLCADFPISDIQHATLHAHYLGQQNPEQVYRQQRPRT